MKQTKANKILIIEDEEKIAHIVTGYLTKEGYRVTAAYTGEEGIKKLSEAPDIIILDLGLPDMDGEEICRMIRKTSHVPIMMLTAKSNEEDKIKGLSIGADDYITKPFSPKEMVARVNALMRRSTKKEGIQNTDEDLTNFIGSIEIFNDLSHNELEVLSTNMEMVEFQDGQTVKKRGKIGRFIWVIFDGNVEIVTTTPDGARKIIASPGKGEILGEMSIMTGEPGSADIIARGSCKLIRIPREVFSQVIIGNRKVLGKIAQIITKRLIRRENEGVRLSQLRQPLSITEIEDTYDLNFSSVEESFKIVVINCGSSSLKYSLFDTTKKLSLIRGEIEEVGGSTVSFR